MRPFWRFMAFFIASIIEVQVHASSWVTLAETHEPIQLPEDCLIESSVCTVRTLASERYNFRVGTHEVTLAPQSVFSRLSSNSGTLISGTVFVRAQTGFALETPYGKFLSDGAEFLVTREGTKFKVACLRGTLEMKPRGHEKALLVKPGFQNWMSRVNTHGKAEVGIPTAMDFSKTLGDIAPLFSGGKEKFASFAKDLHMSWHESVELSATTYEVMVDRELASQAQKERDAAEAKKRWEAERNHWRKILWDKSFE